MGVVYKFENLSGHKTDERLSAVPPQHLREHCEKRANGIDWLALTAVVGSSVAGALVMWGIGHLIYRVIVGAWL